MRYKIITDEGEHYIDAENAGQAQLIANQLWPEDGPRVIIEND